MNFTFTLTKEQTELLVRTLGQTPTETGAFPVYAEIVRQAQAQAQAQAQRSEDPQPPHAQEEQNGQSSGAGAVPVAA